MSITPPRGGRGEPGGYGIEWNVSNGPNGLQFGGTGRGGQILIVWPDLDMIVVSMAGGNAGQLAPLIRQAVKSDQALPANSDGEAQLQKETGAASKALTAMPVPPMPALAAVISGNVYTFPVNSSRLDSLSLEFLHNGSAVVNLKYYGEPFSFPIG
jgi:hypothetical protein